MRGRVEEGEGMAEESYMEGIDTSPI
jgi:hypothetical protein